MKTKFLSVCTGITMVLFGAGFFFYSINNVFAQPASKPSKIMPAEVSKSGKYQVSISQVNKNNGNYIFAVIINTETGVSETYRSDTESPGTAGEWEKYRTQLPQAGF